MFNAARSFILFCTAICVLSACGPFTNQREVEDYDQSCAMDSECEFVEFARACECSKTVAVHTSQVEQVKKDNSEELSSSSCQASGPCSINVAPNEAYCNAGTCGVRGATK